MNRSAPEKTAAKKTAAKKSNKINSEITKAKAAPAKTNKKIKKAANTTPQLRGDKVKAVKGEMSELDTIDGTIRMSLLKTGKVPFALRKDEVNTRISPLVMNTWFRSLDEAVDHPRAVAKLDITRQKSLDRLAVLSDLPYLEELSFIEVNIENFQGLTSVSKLRHIKIESCEVNGWMGLLDLKGLKKLGCYPKFPPNEVKRLLEEEGVEVYLFTPTRVNETEVLGVSQSFSGIRMNHEEAFAK